MDSKLWLWSKETQTYTYWKAVRTKKWALLCLHFNTFLVIADPAHKVVRTMGLSWKSKKCMHELYKHWLLNTELPDCSTWEQTFRMRFGILPCCNPSSQFVVLATPIKFPCQVQKQGRGGSQTRRIKVHMKMWSDMDTERRMWICFKCCRCTNLNSGLVVGNRDLNLADNSGRYQIAAREF